MDPYSASALGIGSLFSGLFSGIFGGKAAGSAAQAQMYQSQLGYKGIQEALGEYRHQFDVLQQNLQPFVQAGTGALGEITALMGLPETTYEYKRDEALYRPMGDVTKGEFVTPEEWNKRAEELLPRKGGIAPPGAREPMYAPDVGDLPAEAFGGMPTQKELELGYREVKGPKGGTFRIPIEAITTSGEERQQAAYKEIEESSEFLERVRVGEEALLAHKSVTGGLRGGNLQAALAQFRPQMLSQLINEKIANLGGLAGLGQTSAAGVGGGAMQLGQGALMAGINAANILGQSGTAQAQGILGGYQAWQPLMNLPSDILKSYVLAQGVSGKGLFG